MKRVFTAIEKGRCVVAVSGSLLKDASVMLALTDRADLPSVALSGPAVAPVQPPVADAIARATVQQGGVIVLVEPELVDMPAVKQLGEAMRRAPFKPEIIVVAKAYNPFLFGSSLQGFKITHEKGRGAKFIADLPMPPAPTALPTERLEAAKAKKGDNAPRLVFAGREEEIASLLGLFGEGGPIVVSGAPGVGRSLLIEHAIDASGLQRLPDLTLGFATGADSLAARLAVIADAGGSPALKEALESGAKPAEVAAAAVTALQAASGTEGQIMVVRELDWALGRQSDFFRKSRLELLLEAILTARYPLRLVFVSAVQPVFHREAHNQAIRRFEVGGIKGRFLHEIFEAFHAPEFPRDRIGPIAERIHGHPFAARTFAVAVRERGDGLERVDDPKFLKADEPGDTRSLLKELGKRLEKLDRGLREALLVVAHFREAPDGRMLADMGISRKDRAALLSLGLLDVLGTVEGPKRYRVHPLVRGLFTYREITDFDVLRKASDLCAKRASESEGIERLAWGQQANRLADLGHDGKGGFKLELPDHDGLLDSLSGLLRRREPRYDLVDKQIGRILERNPSNADAHLLRLHAMFQAHAKPDVVAGALDQAMEKAPVPEVFHQAASFWMHRNARVKAIQVMERAVEVLPDHSRLLTRLAALLLEHGRRPEAIAGLFKAMELDPQLPDAYGLLGMARRDEGADKLEEAETLLREAVRLAPDDATQVSRLAGLLMDQARVVELDVAQRLRAEAAELLDGVLKRDKRSPEAQLMRATLIREEGGDLERAIWLLDKAKKRTERSTDRKFRISLERARIQTIQGELDASERRIRELAEKDPASDKVFAALAEVLVARNLLIPAHAEFMRARDRTPPNSLARQEYETEIARLAALIEAQAAGLAPISEAAPSPTPELHSASAFRTIRRRTDAEVAADEAAAEAAAEPAAPVEPVESGGAESAAVVEPEAAAAALAEEAVESTDAAPIEDQPNAT